MKRPLEALWLASAAAFVAYPVGDIFNAWEMEPLLVLIAAPILLFLGRNVGKREMARG